MKVAGADVWKGRWIIVALNDGQFDAAFVAATVDDAIGSVPDATAVGIDIPIGLPQPGQRRPADEQARKYVGPRWQSVFLTPSGDLLEAESHAAANELAKADGRDGISAQAYALSVLILQVQPVAARDTRLHEVHPEVSFVCVNGGAHLLWAKSSWNRVNLRRRILEENGIVAPEDLGAAGCAGVADVLDAAIAAWSANRIALGKAESFPTDHERIGAIWR